MIDIHKLEKKYSSSFTLRIGELHIDDGERVAVIGQNGSGKSTLLRILAGIIQPDSGSFTVNTTKSAIGYEPQDPYCFAGSVESNVRLGSHNEKNIDELLRSCKLYEMKDKRSSRLSGGEKQRMCFARMLAGQYSCLMLDEPFSAADIDSSENLERLLTEYCSKWGTTLLMSTHLPLQALAISTKILILHDGAVAEYSDTGRVLDCPASEFGQKFMNRWRIG